MDELESIEHSLAEKCTACRGTGQKNHILDNEVIVVSRCAWCDGSGLDRDVQRLWGSSDLKFDSTVTNPTDLAWMFRDFIKGK